MAVYRGLLKSISHRIYHAVYKEVFHQDLSRGLQRSISPGLHRSISYRAGRKWIHYEVRILVKTQYPTPLSINHWFLDKYYTILTALYHIFKVIYSIIRCYTIKQYRIPQYIKQCICTVLNYKPHGILSISTSSITRSLVMLSIYSYSYALLSIKFSINEGPYI